jgi:Flp pilus assembly pilin Flp
MPANHSTVVRFVMEETAQDLVEYSLILGFIALVAAASYIGIGSSLRGLWGIANGRLANANQSVS